MFLLEYERQNFGLVAISGCSGWWSLTILSNSRIADQTLTTTATTTALFSPQMLKIIIVYSRFTQLQNKEDHGHPKIAGASRVK